MAGTVNFNRTVLTVGSHALGQAPLAIGDKHVVISINRGISGGLDSVPVSTTLELVAEYSIDGGATWLGLFSAGTNGGQFFDKTGAVLPVTLLGDNPSGPGLPNQDIARLIRASVTIVGTSVAVSGSITVT